MTDQNGDVAAVRLVVLDVDGVLTDGRLYYTEHGETLKAFHVHDGLGIRAARENGLAVAVISAKQSAALERRLADLGVRQAFLGVDDKWPVFDRLVNELGISVDQVAYVGDDRIDLPVMRRVGVPVAVANAQDAVKAVACHITSRSGGSGAVREAIDWVLSARGALDDAYRFIDP